MRQSATATLTIPVSDRDHTQGNPNAPLTLLEYGDYQCPSCGAAYPIVKEVQTALGDDVRFVFRNFPLTQSHKLAQMAAEAAEAAAAQGKFWEMHDMLFENQHHLQTYDLEDYAEQLGLEVERFKGDLDEHNFADRVREDFMGGVRSGVNGTPTFYINGARHDGSYDAESLIEALEAARE